MRILDTLGFLLITGSMLRTTVGDEMSSGTPGAQPPHLNIFGFANTTLEEIEEYDRQLCETHGGPTAHDEHKKSREQFKSCDASVNYEIHQAVVMSHDSPRDGFKSTFYTEYCRRVPNFKNCMKNLTDSAKTCLDTARHETADIVYNLYSAMLGFMCDDLAARMKEITARGFDRCMVSTMPVLRGCANETIVKYVQATVSNGAAIGGIGALHLLVPDATKCAVFEKFQHCAIDALRNCETSTPADVTSSVFTLVNKVTTCDVLLKSDASTTRIVNVVLITALAAMSLRFVYKV